MTIGHTRLFRIYEFAIFEPKIVTLKMKMIANALQTSHLSFY